MSEMDTSGSTIATYLADHPKMTGVLFTTLVLLAQAQSVLAAAGSSNTGP
ncbi:DUF7503 family protein [Halomarina pelagica]|nr:hypothetical protein [Halomarina sp. BND7]